MAVFGLMSFFFGWVMPRISTTFVLDCFWSTIEIWLLYSVYHGVSTMTHLLYVPSTTLPRHLFLFPWMDLELTDYVRRQSVY